MTKNDVFYNILKIRNKLKEKKIKYYKVHFVDSGFGDLITCASIASFYSDLLGLKFRGIANEELKFIAFYSYFYEKFLNDLSIFPNEEKISYIKINNPLLDTQIILDELEHIDDESVICIAPQHLFHTDDYGFIAYEMGLNLYKNQFIDFFHEKLEHFGFYKQSFYDMKHINITLHLRLGDCAALPLNNQGDIIVCDWFGRAVNTHSWYNLKTKKGNEYVLEKYTQLERIINFTKEIKKKIPNARVNLITNGYDICFQEIYKQRFQDNLKNLNKTLDINVVKEYIDKQMQILNEDQILDKKIVGENYEKFLASIQCILGSNIIVSNHRSFVFRVLAGWKKDLAFPQNVFLNGLEQGQDTYLKELNISLNKYTDYNIILEQIVSKKENSQTEFLNHKQTILKLYDENTKLLQQCESLKKEKEKIKEHLSYKLGEALIKAYNNVWGGGIVKFLFIDVPRIKREFREKRDKK
ncbi:hypothetical protein DMB92_08925 [Campylobacter sp. MIT 99-7217]|uniref:hypothetical protein n=1 Tax=Campylobacter sp. MIT 99-7217 TaxID=535091 RepID=UPI001159E0AC|nr:hypothetical protein [Campylobacter sp. MIT 99-7217]TQR28850.1 hypothetical protein DMB92_08925 [Campylobacter sp. MIT 99-7217]